MKKLIFCFDGTCNDPEDSGDFFEDSSVSNILKLHAFLGGSLNPLNAENPKTSNQHSFYYSGVGTRGSWLKQKFNAVFAPPYGDMDDILDEAHKDLDRQNYKKEDEIYIFGFSRGAAIARMFAANIGKKVTFLGVFDTVAATRGSLDLNPESYPASGIVFEDGTIGKHIKKAVHLVSIDEKRLAFQPTLFNKDQRVTEVWFAGVHSDVGGGYWFDGLSDITLRFMINCIKDKLQVLDIKSIDYGKLKISGAQDAICFDDLNINPITNGKLHEQKRPGIKAKTLAPRLIRVNIDDQPSKKIPIIHHTVSDRFHDVTEYRPYALRDASYYIMDKNGTVDTKSKHTGIASL
ncbi:phospholipase effector Tle1 domain-containing protein [Desulfotalea psychrophila]|uniref:T6SS Phospholipase effector Tle1-like catalytic domain-containing protein n=1 Tax=Desulfotalea psychrophila (strain LSv54 / DSM 12343) TaxID=177439 RepID=Q6AQS6_DESPS|nr:DUF2235 domain-containing protein [Desulfotalea psychrophila]CAG35297.1 hypothetical protein DP0568 [Desulfotalea psychrophila LSv54]